MIIKKKSENIKIYADFNGTEICTADPNILCLNLTGYGTLASLSFHRVKLRESQRLLFGDIDGLTSGGTTYFDKNRITKNCSGWFARIDQKGIYEDVAIDHNSEIHVCFSCRKNVKHYLDLTGRLFDEHCPFCGESVMTPLSPP